MLHFQLNPCATERSFYGVVEWAGPWRSPQEGWERRTGQLCESQDPPAYKPRSCLPESLLFVCLLCGVCFPADRKWHVLGTGLEAFLGSS